MTTTTGNDFGLTQFSVMDPTTWIPTYGLFGGPNWSAGQRDLTKVKRSKKGLAEQNTVEDVAIHERKINFRHPSKSIFRWRKIY